MTRDVYEITQEVKGLMYNGNYIDHYQLIYDELKRLKDNSCGEFYLKNKLLDLYNVLSNPSNYYCDDGTIVEVIKLLKELQND